MKLGTLYTLYGRRAGAELLFEKTLTALFELRDDLDVVVFCNREAQKVLSSVTPRLRAVYVPLLNKQISKAWWLQFPAAEAVNEEHCDVFWIPSGANSFPGRWKAPTVVTFCDLGEFRVESKYDPVRMFYRKALCVPLSVRRARVMTTISQQTTDDLVELFHPACPVHTVHPGPSPRELTLHVPHPTAVVARETSLDLERVFFAPARTDFRGKGLDLLLDAYARFAAEISDAPPLIIAGPRGVGHERLETALRSPDLQGKAYWVGRVSDTCIDAFYTLSEMVLYPSRYEGFGFPALEAMLHGVPVICSDAGSLPEVVGSAALIFPSGDEEGLYRAMRRLHGDETARRELVEAGRERVKFFTWESLAQKMLAALNEAAGC
ncbi:MAG: glycosyltransferase family 4 protein [Kiritimatiellae bacterium]|nr:glycosyltransferase family 4 protein [Kiritimatiellia bacterium]